MRVTVIALKLTERRTITDYFQQKELLLSSFGFVPHQSYHVPLMQQMVPAFMFADVCLEYHFLPVAFYSVYRKYLVK